MATSSSFTSSSAAASDTPTSPRGHDVKESSQPRTTPPARATAGVEGANVAKFNERFTRILSKLMVTLGINQKFTDEFINRFSDAPGAVFLRYISNLGAIMDRITAAEGISEDEAYRNLGILCAAMALTPQIRAGQTFPWRNNEVPFKEIQIKFSMTGEKTSNVGADKIPYSFYQKLGLGGAAQIANQLGNLSFYRLYCDRTNLPRWFCSPLMLLLPFHEDHDKDLRTVVSNFENKVRDKYRNKKNPDKNIRSWENIYKRGKETTIDSAILGKLYSMHPLIKDYLDLDKVNGAFKADGSDLVPVMATFATIRTVFSAGSQDQPVASKAGDYGVQPSEIARQTIQASLALQSQAPPVP